MNDKNATDADPTRPTKPYRPNQGKPSAKESLSSPRQTTADQTPTKPIRVPNDPENTVLSKREAAPSDPATISSPAEKAEPTARARPSTRRRVRPTGERRRALQPTRATPVRTGFTWWQTIVRGLSILSLLFILIAVLALSVGVMTYFWIARQLPPAEQLRSRSFQFATSQILDRDGNLLWEIIDPTGGRRTTVTLDQVSPALINGTIATEDRFFYLNVGVDPIAITRAVYYNYTAGEIVSGASTITQQLARNVLLNPEERNERTFNRKIREAILAVEINRRYTKEQILEIYLNQIYYGNLAYGIEAASQTYFGKQASELSLAEASLLAGLPQSPAVHDPYVNPDGAKSRQADVLRLMVEAGYITAAQAEEALLTDLELRALGAAFEAPHFVTFVRQELERIVPPEYLYQAGWRVQTTLDPRLQAIAEEEIRTQVDALSSRNVLNGALVALDVETGQILALVGSKDFRNEAIDGQVNMAISPRQPGSTMKPLTYLAAFERLAWTPSSLIMDVPVEYPDGAGNVYKPNNYDEKFHGPVSLRVALANSYNIPPIKALEAIGVNALKEIATRLGITTLTRNDYGLSLTLGSGEVPLVEMTGAYQVMANGGRLKSPTAILEITDTFGRVIEQPSQLATQQVLREEHAYLMTHILADNEARSISFGPNSELRLSRPAAAKTGTTNDFIDNWTIGYTPDIVAGVWVGNADRAPMMEVSGLIGAGPVWHNFMERAHEGRPIRDFSRPATIVELEVCADSGTIPSEVCPERRREIFFRDQPPLGPEEDIHQIIEIDLKSNLRANDFCQTDTEERYFRVYPPDGWEWAIDHGFEQPPTDYCPSSNIVARINNPIDGSTVNGILALEGTAVAANFDHYQIEVGIGTGPQAFAVIQEPNKQLVEQGILGIIDTTQVDNGPYTLRLRVFNQNGVYSESRVRIIVDNERPSPTPSSTATETPVIPTETPMPEPTATIPPATPTFSPTPLPTELATETPIILPTETFPTETPTLPPPTEIPPEPLIPPTESPVPEPTAEKTRVPGEIGTATPEP